MKKQIRLSVFETNSSSVHTLIFCTREEYKDWESGKCLYDIQEDEFIPIKPYSKEEKENIVKDYYKNKYQKKSFTKKYSELTADEKSELVNEVMSKGLFKPDRSNDHYYTYDEWFYNGDMEAYENFYITEHGDEIVAFGRYGYDH